LLSTKGLFQTVPTCMMIIITCRKKRVQRCPL